MSMNTSVIEQEAYRMTQIVLIEMELVRSFGNVTHINNIC